MSQSQKINSHFLLLGSGRLARHLHFYFQTLNLSFSTWDRSQDPHLLLALRDKATHVLLAVSDTAIEGVHRKYFAGFDKKIVHFSGALEIPGLASAHPLMTFGEDLYAAEFYPRIHFVVGEGHSLPDLLPGLPNSFSTLPAADKALYHAFCVLSGNFTTLLIQKSLAGMESMQIPAEALRLYVEKSVQNAFAFPKAFTGPLARQDALTVQKNLQALQDDSYQNIYRAFVQAHWPHYSEMRHEHT